MPSWVGCVLRRGVYRRVLAFSLLSLFLTVGMSPVLSQMPVANLTLLAQDNPELLVNESKKKYENGEFSQAVQLLQRAAELFEAQGQSRNQAITLVNLGRMQSELGQQYQACETLRQALGLSSDVCEDKDLPKKEPREWVSEPLKKQDLVQVNSLRLFGDVLRAIGRLEESQQILEFVETLVEKPPFSEQAEVRGAVLLSLGNTFLAKGNLERDRQAPIQYEYEYLPWHVEKTTDKSESYEKAEIQYKCVVTNCTTLQTVDKAYEQVVMSKPSLSVTGIKAQLNLLSLFLETGQLQAAQELSNVIDLSNLPVSRTKIYAEIKLAKNLTYLEAHKDKGVPLWGNITKQIETAIEEAETLKDKRAESYARGNLGGLYEYLGKHQHQIAPSNWKQGAQRLTQEALYLAQPSESPDIAYQWQWQLGRLLEAEGKSKRKEAIAYYEAAVKTLESVRGDLLTINSDVQFSFRDNVEPLYRELVALLLPIEEKQPKQDKLKKSLYYVDSLQLAELQNFLRCDPQGYVETVQTNQSDDRDDPIEALIQRINQILDNYPTKAKAAFIYPIILENQVLSILKLPGQKKEFIPHINRINKDELNGILEEAKNAIKKYKARPSKLEQEEYQKIFSYLYQLLIGELETTLKQEKIKNLILVPDSSFRTIPMSALFDGKQFMVEKDYSTSVVSSVQLLKSKPKYSDLDPTQLNVLLAGAIKERIGYTSIKQSVEEQIESVKNILTKAKVIDQGKLTKAIFKKELNNSFYEIIHLVAHGQFSSNPEEAYILTDEDHNDKNKNSYFLKINELGDLIKHRNIRKSIELLFLSACNAAEGDNRAVLGIAGVAVRSGAKGTIAPLWKVDQESSNLLVEEFYDNLINQKLSKTEALRRAQNTLRKKREYKSPYHWAPFILVGN
ncbi:MAG: CHAT domain-containing protein [Symploca sp. SIO2E9]|nr:CHAT domain-containing protein [Symploca sp. SIO2E9]